MDFTKISQKVKDADLGSARMTDAKKAHVYSIIDSNDTGVTISSDKGHKIPVSWAGLAAMRITANATEAVKIEDTRLARDNENISNFQSGLNADTFKLDETLKLTCVHKLKIKDTVNDRPVYRNECYTGYGAYLDACNDINADPATKKMDDNSNSVVRLAAFNKATAALRKTDLKKGTVETEASWVQMPVFTASN